MVAGVETKAVSSSGRSMMSIGNSAALPNRPERLSVMSGAKALEGVGM
jgi:hypothetical protein